MAMEGLPRKRLLWTGRALLAFFIGSLAVNFFTGSFFTIDERCVYTAGSLRQLAFSLLAAFNAYGSVATLFRMPRAEGAFRRRNKMMFAIGITMTAAILVQLGDPLLPLYSLGCMFGLCLLHVFVVEDVRQKTHLACHRIRNRGNAVVARGPAAGPPDPLQADLPVYLVTAAVEARNQVESDGFTGILLKPVSLDNLKALLGQ